MIFFVWTAPFTYYICKKQQQPTHICIIFSRIDLMFLNITKSQRSSENGWERCDRWLPGYIYLCAGQLKIFKMEMLMVISEKEADRSDDRHRERWTAGCVIQILPLIPNPPHGSMQRKGQNTVEKVGN